MQARQTGMNSGALCAGSPHPSFIECVWPSGSSGNGIGLFDYLHQPLPKLITLFVEGESEVPLLARTEYYCTDRSKLPVWGNDVYELVFPCLNRPQHISERDIATEDFDDISIASMMANIIISQ